MDTLSHYLWTVPLYWQHPKRWLLGLFGALPDLLSFGIFMVQRAVAGTYSPGKPGIESIPPWLFAAYDLTHSLVVFAAVFLLLFWRKREWSWLIMGWPLHILMDIPTHSNRFFPTPYLWPLPHPFFDGLSFMTPWFLAMNFAALAGVYAWLLTRMR